MNEKICNVPVTTRKKDQILHAIKEDIRNRRQSLLIAVNPEKIMKARHDQQLMSILHRADYPIPDGIGVILASKWKKGALKERVTGVDMMLALISLAADEEYRVFLYGAKPETVKKAAESLKQEYPDLHLAGWIDGYQSDQEAVIDKINEAKPDILFVALGSPAQEEWILSNKERLDVSVFQGVGGSFDVISGDVKRAPAVFQKAGLEWLYRLLSDPRRIRRQLVLPQFLLEVVRNDKPGKDIQEND